MFTVKGMVTRTHDYRDNDKVVNIFTTDGDIVTAAMFGAKSAKGGKSIATQLFTFGEYVLSQRNENNLISSFSVLESFCPITQDYNKYKVGCIMLSSINTSMSQSDSNSDVYDLLHYVISYLAFSNVNHMDLVIYFLLTLMNYIGFCPCITECACCGKNLRTESKASFSLEDGGSVCIECLNSGQVKCHKLLSALSLEAMRRILLLTLTGLNKLVLPQCVRDELYDCLIDYSEYYLERTFQR